MELYTHKMLEEGRIVKKLKIRNGVNPKKYLYKYGQHVEEIEIDIFYGKFWRLCPNLKIITIDFISYCNLGFLYHSLPETIEVIVLKRFWDKGCRKLIKNYKNAVVEHNFRGPSKIDYENETIQNVYVSKIYTANSELTETTYGEKREWKIYSSLKKKTENKSTKN